MIILYIYSLKAGKMLITPNHVYSGPNRIDLTKDTVYTHPAAKQCNYSYTHPTSKQCTWTPDLSQATGIQFTLIGDVTYIRTTSTSVIFRAASVPDFNQYFAIIIKGLSLPAVIYVSGTYGSNAMYINPVDGIGTDGWHGPLQRSSTNAFGSSGAFFIDDASMVAIRNASSTTEQSITLRYYGVKGSFPF